MNMRKVKRFLALVMTFLLILSLVPGVALTARAEGAGKRIVQIDETALWGDSETYQLSYNSQGLLETIQSRYPKTCCYDEAGRYVAYEYNGTRTPVYTYDDMGNLIYEYERIGDMYWEYQYTYDADGKLTYYSYKDNYQEVSITYEYRSDGLLSTATFNTGEIQTYEYNSQGQLITKTSSNGDITRYTYDERGNLIKEAFPDGETVEYEYDDNNRVTVIQHSDYTEYYTYDTEGRMASLRTVRALYGGEVDEETEFYTYDTEDRIVSIRIESSRRETEWIRYDYERYAPMTVKITDGNVAFLDIEGHEVWSLYRSTAYEELSVSYDTDGYISSVTSENYTWTFTYEETEVVPPYTHEHSYTATVVPPTCTEDGYTIHTCTCGESYKDSATPSGHQWDSGTVTTAPTENQQGVRTYTCTACGQTRTESIPAESEITVTGAFLANSSVGEKEITVENGTVLKNGIQYFVQQGGYLYFWDDLAVGEVQKVRFGYADVNDDGKAELMIDIQNDLGWFLDLIFACDGNELAYMGAVYSFCPIQYCKEHNSIQYGAYALPYYYDGFQIQGDQFVLTGQVCEDYLAMGWFETEEDFYEHMEYVDGMLTACEHERTQLENAQEATCTAAGYTGDTVCSACGETVRTGETIPATGHTEETTPAVAATCTTTGLTEGKKCSVCGIVTIAQETVPVIAHSYENGVCSVCGKEEDTGAVIAEGTCGDHLTWTLDNQGTLTISGTGEMVNYYNYEGPFEGVRDQIKKVIIADGVTSIGANAFYECGALTEITIPDSVISIARNAFYMCSSLTAVTIPDSVTNISEYAFWWSGLTSVTIPRSVGAIDGWVFYCCKNLTDVVISEGITSIGEEAFEGCEKLISVTIPDSVASIGVDAFAFCEKLPSVTIPASVTNLGAKAFYWCDSLSEIIFQGNAPVIGEDCFAKVEATAYYPAENSTWTEDVKQNYGGTITWATLDGCLHEYSIINTKSPSCTEAGYTGDMVCDLCGEILGTGLTIPATGHSYTNGICTACGQGQASGQGASLLRLAGAHRYETAFKAADQMKVNLGISKFDAVVVASGMDFADALSGSYLAAVKDAPILLACNVASVNNLVKDYINANLKSGGTVYILGGTRAIPESFSDGLGSFNIKRLAGANRFATNLLVLEEAGVGNKDILVCTGMGFADSLSASATKLPILLVYGSKLMEEQEDYLAGLSGNDLYVIGGESAVSDSIYSQLSDFGGAIRLKGGNRFETSVVIAQYFFQNPEAAVLAYAWNFPDGLCGGSLAASMDAPLILTMQNWESNAAAYIQNTGIQTGIILGGEGLIPDASVDMIFNTN